MTNPEDVLEALRHTRHDWLNVMQLIKGNLALQRYDRIETIIETVTQKSVNESKLSSMGTPKVATYLLTYNWKSYSLKLDIDVVGDVKSIASHEINLKTICETVVEQLSNSSAMDTENTLVLTFLFKDEVCELTFEYHGNLKMKKDKWAQILNKLEPKVNLVEWNEHECVLFTCFTLS